mgnify:CR=1 FL=1
MHGSKLVCFKRIPLLPMREPTSISIDVYADIVCPWCYVGRARLQTALDRRPDVEATIRWRPFQLQPDLPSDGKDFRTVLEQKFGSWERAQQMFEHVETMGDAEGLPFDFDAMDVVPNTGDAHRLVLWAQERNAGEEMAERLFKAYFTEGADISDAAVLVDCAADVGLDGDAARSLLDGTEYADAVRDSQQQAHRHGINGVPCYVLDDRYAVTGAQPADVMGEALDAALSADAA